MPDLPARKNIRLEEYDYSQAGCYFVTMCVKGGHEMLGSVGANCVRPVLSEMGAVAEGEIRALSHIYDNVFVDKYVIMPNHIHAIIMIANDGRTQFAPTVSRIIKQFKGSVTKQIGFSIWQKSFHDRIIRSEAEYQKIWQYIDQNPARWQDDCYYTKQPPPTPTGGHT